MMKKNIVFIIVYLCFLHTSYAQVWLIPKVGMSLGNYQIQEYKDHAILTSLSDDMHFKGGITTGISLMVACGKDSPFAIQTDLNYIQKGYESNNLAFYSGTEYLTIEDKAYQVSKRLHYIELPVLAKWSFGNKAIEGYINSGPFLGIGLGGNYEMGVYMRDEQVYSVVESEKLLFRQPAPPISDEEIKAYNAGVYRRLDWGVQIGAGMNVNIGIGKLIADARYGIGFNQVVKPHTYYQIAHFRTHSSIIHYDIPANFKSRTFAFTLGYAIPLGR